MEFPEILNKTRTNRNISTGEFADELGVSPSTISLWESGKRTPDYKTIIKICNYFKITSDYLLGINADTTNRLILNLISNDTIVEPHINYYKKRKAIGFNHKEYTEQDKKLDKEILALKAQIEATKKLLNKNISFQNKKLLDTLSYSISDLRIEIIALEKKKKELYQDVLTKGKKLDKIEQKSKEDMNILYNLQQVIINNHYRNSLVYQILFLNDLGILIDTNHVTYTNHQSEIKKVFEKSLKEINENLHLSEQEDIKKIIDDIEHKSREYLSYLSKEEEENKNN